MKKIFFLLAFCFTLSMATAAITKDNIKSDTVTCLSYEDSITASDVITIDNIVYTPLYMDIYQMAVPNYDGPCGGPTSSCTCDTTGPYCYMTCTDPDGSSVSIRVPCPIGNNG